MLNITLLGTPQITWEGQPLVLRPRNSARARAILYYLAAEGRPVSRERLAGLLWSDWPEKKARDYLRGELFLLGPLRPSPLREAEARLDLDPSNCASDLAAFRQLTERAGSTVEEMQQALHLCTGPFLQDFESAIETSAVLYLDWLHEQRRAWSAAERETRYRLAESAAQTQRRLDLGIAACTHLLAEEPEREEVHRLKMRLLASSGQRTAALKQYDACTRALLNELGVPPSVETNALYDQILAGEVGPPAVTAPGAHMAPFQAPAPAEHFVGRQAEREQLEVWLTQPQRGSITAIVGMGGAGKTALAVELAHLVRQSFPDGVLWARVSDDSPLDVLQSWALAFDKDLSKIVGAEARAAAMRNILAGKRALVVLDDVVAGHAIDLLLPGSTCSVLITTRDWAEVAARTTQIVELLELTLPESLALLRCYLGDQGVQAEEEAAVTLCTTLGGLPLAVEIAAQRVFASPRRSLARMVRSLQAADNRLAHGISNRSVRTSFHVSWEALSPALQRLFALTGVFDGRPFPPAALAAAAGDSSGDQMIDQLDGLVTLSMLKPADHERYVHHRLLADFAAEKLSEQPDAAAAELRFAAWCRRLVQQAAGNYDELESEWETLLWGLALAHKQGDWQLLAQSVDGLTAPWFARARFAQAQQGFRWALEAATVLGDDSRYAGYAYYLAKTYLRQDDYSAARQLLDSAIAIFQTMGDQLRLADAHVDLADVALEQGDYAGAAADLGAAESMYQKLQHPVGVATVKTRQALLAYYESRYDDAYMLCQQGLACLPANDGAIARSRTLRLLSDLAMRKQQFDEAVEFCAQAQTANQSANDPTEAAAILYAQAKLDHFLGNHAESLVSARQSAQLYAAMGDRKATAIVYNTIALLHLRHHEIAESKAAVATGLEIAQALQDADILGECYQLLAEIQQAEAIELG